MITLETAILFFPFICSNFSPPLSGITAVSQSLFLYVSSPFALVFHLPLRHPSRDRKWRGGGETEAFLFLLTVETAASDLTVI